jgi:methyl-accepting chemotaxis protein
MLSQLSLHPRDLLALLSLAAAAFASGIDAFGWQVGWLLAMAVSGLYLLHGIGRREQRVVAALAHTARCSTTGTAGG